MAEVNKVGIVLFTFMALIIGIPLLNAIADQVSLVDQTYTATNETITLNNGTAVSLANNWVTSVTSVVANNTGTFSTTLTETTNYTVGNLNDDGVATITLITADCDGNSTYVTYVYQDDSYIRGSTSSQVIIKLVVIFFVLGIFAVSIYGVVKSGLLDQLK